MKCFDENLGGVSYVWINNKKENMKNRWRDDYKNKWIYWY